MFHFFRKENQNGILISHILGILAYISLAWSGSIMPQNTAFLKLYKNPKKNFRGKQYRLEVCNQRIHGTSVKSATECLFLAHRTGELSDMIYESEELYKIFEAIMEYFWGKGCEEHLTTLINLRSILFKYDLKNYKDYERAIYAQPDYALGHLNMYIKLLGRFYCEFKNIARKYLVKRRLIVETDGGDILFNNISLTRTYANFMMKLLKLNPYQPGWYIFEPNDRATWDEFRQLDPRKLKKFIRYEERFFSKIFGSSPEEMRAADLLFKSFSNNSRAQLSQVFGMFQLKNYWENPEISISQYVKSLKARADLLIQ